MKREFAIYMRESPVYVDGRWVTRVTEGGRVRVLARSDGYAMVRRSGAEPFVVSEKSLRVEASR